MTGVFVDTAYWLALLLRRDELHARALQWRQYLLPPFVTTWAVLFEVGAALTADRHFVQAGYRALLLEEPAGG